MADTRLVEIILGIHKKRLPRLESKIDALYLLLNDMASAAETFKTVFNFLLTERALLKSQLEAALNNDATDAATIAQQQAAIEEQQTALTAAAAKVGELQTLADTDVAEDQELLALVQPVVDEINAQTPTPSDPPAA